MEQENPVSHFLKACISVDKMRKKMHIYNYNKRQKNETTSAKALRKNLAYLRDREKASVAGIL